MELAKKFIEPIPRHDPPPAGSNQRTGTIGRTPRDREEGRAVAAPDDRLSCAGGDRSRIARAGPDRRRSCRPGRARAFYKRMVERRAAGAFGERPEQAIRSIPPLMIFTINPRSGVDPAQTEKALYEELDELQHHPGFAARIAKGQESVADESLSQMKTIAGGATDGTLRRIFGDYKKMFTIDASYDKRDGGRHSARREEIFHGEKSNCGDADSRWRSTAGGRRGRSKSMKIASRFTLLAAFASLNFAQSKLPQYTESKLPNGVVIAMMPRTGVPLVHFRIVMTWRIGIGAEAVGGLAGVTYSIACCARALRSAQPTIF